MDRLNCKLDWLSFTYKSSDTFDEKEIENFKEVFPELSCLWNDGIIVKVVKENAQRFYNQVIGFNDCFSIAYRDTPLGGSRGNVNLGVNVSIPAHGLEYFFSLFGLKKDQVTEMLGVITLRGCNVSRLDLAYDDFSKTFKPSHFMRWFQNGQIVTNYKSGKYVFSRQNSADTFYLGSRTAGKLLRIYDKNAESDGKIDAIRYEFELHQDHTKPYVHYILSNGTAPDFGVIMKKFIIKILEEYDLVAALSSSTKKADRKPLQSWEDFVCADHGFCAQLEISTFKDQSDLLKKQSSWIVNQVMPTLKTFLMLYGWQKFAYIVENSKVNAKYDILKALYDMRQPEYDDYLADLVSDALPLGNGSGWFK